MLLIQENTKKRSLDKKKNQKTHLTKHGFVQLLGIAEAFNNLKLFSTFEIVLFIVTLAICPQARLKMIILSILIIHYD